MDEYKTLWVLNFDYWIEFVWEEESYGDHEISAGSFTTWSERVGIKYPLIVQQVFEESGEWIAEEIVEHIMEYGDLPKEMKNHEWVNIKESKTVYDFKDLIKALYK